MKAKISMLMDGELEESELREALAALSAPGEARTAWCTYHLIRDALRGDGALTADIAGRLCARLALEPTVLAPQRPTRSPARSRWFALSAAASVAAVALVGWLAFTPRPGGGGVSADVPVAQAPQKPVAVVAKTKELRRVPLPSSADDYLLAHQAYSPRLTLQGVAPYIRTVSDDAVQSDTQ